MMKTVYCTLLMLFSFCLIISDCQFCYGQTSKSLHSSATVGDSANGFQVSVTLEGHNDNTNLEADEPVILDITIKNISKNTLNYPIIGDEHLFRFTVVNEAGNEVPLTLYGKQLYDKPPLFMGIFTMTLTPNQQQTDRILISRQYDMSLHGKYIIRVAWQTRAGADGKPVKLITDPFSVVVGDFNRTADDGPHKKLSLDKGLHHRSP